MHKCVGFNPSPGISFVRGGDTARPLVGQAKVSIPLQGLVSFGASLWGEDICWAEYVSIPLQGLVSFGANCTAASLWGEDIVSIPLQGLVSFGEVASQESCDKITLFQSLSRD